MTTPSIRSDVAAVNGLQLYYEIHGSGGRPLIVLHGGIAASESFGPNLPALAASRASRADTRWTKSGGRSCLPPRRLT